MIISRRRQPYWSWSLESSSRGLDSGTLGCRYLLVLRILDRNLSHHHSRRQSEDARSFTAMAYHLLGRVLVPGIMHCELVDDIEKAVIDLTRLCLW